jgi:glycosyltransferase involved in cell wall biosynthesis
MGPTVSVVIPVWNRRELIGEAIDSVLSQQLPPGWHLELIVVDDGSDDGTAEYLDTRFTAGSTALDGCDPARDPARDRSSDGARDPAREGVAPSVAEPPSVRVVHTAHCGFPGAARNRGVREAAGQLLAFLDSDDRWLPGKLQAQIPLHRPETGDGPVDPASGSPIPARFSHTRERWVRNGREVSQRSQRHRRAGDIFLDALVKCIVGPSTVMIETALYRTTGGFREDLEVAEDYEYWLRLLATTPVAYVDRPLTVKQAGPWEQLSEKYGEIERFRIAALRDLVVAGAFAGKNAEDPQIDVARDTAARRELARKLRVYAAGARKRGRTAEADALEEEADTFENSIPDL